MTVSSALPLPASAILSTVGRFSMLTSSQLHRLHYQATNPGAYVRSRRHLTRLVKLGLLRRFWGVYMDAPEYVYLPPTSKARSANMHTLDISQLYVDLVYASESRDSVIYDPEPWCHVNVGHMVLKPDAYVDLGRMRYFVEMDRGTEFRSALAQKMRRYIAAFERWDEQTFPQVVFICHDRDRQRFINSVIKSQTEPRLFVCWLFDEVVGTMLDNM